MQPSVHPSRAQLEAFDRGKLELGAWSTVEEHLRLCESCRRDFDALPEQSFVDLVRELLVETATSGPDQQTPLYHAAPRAAEVPGPLAAHPRYQVLAPLGAGGMGQVFKAQHRLMERVVALKILQPALLERPTAVERFRQEVRAAAQLAHPNIVTAYDADQAGDIHFLVMEYVEGATLDRYLKRCGPLPLDEACRLIQQAALGLQHAFERGMVHRDLKPSNLILTPQGTVKILDFGLARFASELPLHRALTPSETLVGTPDYLAPEQARDPRQATIQSDIYSLGCTLYQLLTGQPPFPDGTIVQRLLAQQEQTPRPVTDFRPNLPPAFAAVLERMLAKDPRARYATPAAVTAALAPFGSDAARPASRTTRKTWPWIALAGTSAALALIVGYVVWLRNPPPDETTQGSKHIDIQPPPPKPAPVEPLMPKPALKPREAPSLSTVQARDWLVANNAFGPGHKIVADTMKELEEKVAAGRAFMVWLGQGLVKSQKTTVLAGRRHDFFVYELAPEEGRGKIADFEKATVVTAPQKDESVPTPRALLSAPSIDQAKALDGNKNVTGTVAFKRVEDFGDGAALRLTFMLGSTTYSHYYRLDNEEITGQKPLSFAFSPLFSQGEPRYGPAVLFLEMCQLSGDPRAGGRVTVISNAAPALVILAQPGKNP